MTLHGKRVLLTGGTTGIGRALLIRLAGEGARVLPFGRDADALDEALAAAGGESSGIVADIGRADEVERIFRAVDDRLGGLDILISNAALGAEPIDKMADAEWRYVVDVNLAGAMACAKASLDRFADAGQIVIVGSISAVIHARGESVYSATKAGLSAFAETLRKEVAERSVRVSLIEPGTTGSDMQAAEPDEQAKQIEGHEMLDADDIADAILYVLTRPERVDIVTLRIEPRIQALS